MRLYGVQAGILVAMLVCLMLLKVPASAAGSFTYIDAAELKALIEQRSPGLIVIDSRGSSQYEEAHIKGAISLPLGTMEGNATLPDAPKDALLVFYCSGTT